jgi:thiol-disulfide isomerase/thioredoxin
MASAKVKAQTIIDENGAVVFSKSYCPYCKASKSLLSELGANFKVLELDQIGMRPTTSNSRYDAILLQYDKKRILTTLL